MTELRAHHKIHLYLMKHILTCILEKMQRYPTYPKVIYFHEVLQQ